MTNIRFIDVLLAVLLAALLGVASQAAIQPSDLIYEGVIAPPRISGQVPKYGYGMWGLQFDPTCGGQPDPSPLDGYPGCLAATSHKENDMIGMFDVVPPTTEHGGDYNLVPVAQQVIDFFKCSIRADGTDIQAELLASGGNWLPRDIPGIVRTPSGDWICTCGHDWYDVSQADYISHCWFDFDPAAQDARGAYGWGEPGDLDFHSQRMAEYLGVIPQDWADANLGANGEPYCYTGMQRRGGGNPIWSPGPAIYAFPCAEPTEPEGSLLMTSVELMGWHGKQMTTNDRPHPEWTPITHTRGVEWVGDTLIASVQKGGDYWWYGQPNPWEDTHAHRNTCMFNAGNPIWNRDGTPCPEEWLFFGPDLPPGTEDHCGRNKGYHALMGPGAEDVQWALQLQFYAASDLALSAAGVIDPSEILPYATITAPDWGWRDDCAAPGGISSDGARLYLVELNGDRPVVHIFRLGDSQPPQPYCGDGTCDPGEDVCNCPEDCGSPPGEDCTDGIDNDCDGLVDCEDDDCIEDPLCTPITGCDQLKLDLVDWLAAYECTGDQ